MDHRDKIRREFARQAQTMAASAVFQSADVVERIVRGVGPAGSGAVLDVGCGPGIVSAALAKAAREVVACDLTPEMLDQARKRCDAAGLKNVRFVQSDAGRLAFSDGTFDAVVSRLAIHHLAEPLPAIREMARVLKTGGRCVLADIVSSEDPDENRLHNALEVLRDPSHVRMLPGSQLRQAAADAGLEILDEQTWPQDREFQEWIRIANAPERSEPLLAVMIGLARAGVATGISLKLQGQTVTFVHQWVMLTLKRK